MRVPKRVRKLVLFVLAIVLTLANISPLIWTFSLWL
jgi:hypothetical protein